jgi:hypothetical protein
MHSALLFCKCYSQLLLLWPLVVFVVAAVPSVAVAFLPTLPASAIVLSESSIANVTSVSSGMLAGAGIGDPTIASVHHYNATSELITFQLQVASAGEDRIKSVKVQLTQEDGNVVGSVLYAKYANDTTTSLGDNFDQSLSAVPIVVATSSADSVGYGCSSLAMVVASLPQPSLSVMAQTHSSSLQS